MLEQIDLTKKMGKEEYKQKMAEMVPQLAKLQRTCRELGIPVMIVFEGFGAAGKGVQISKLISALDPRGFSVYAINGESTDEQLRPFCGDSGPRHRRKAGLRSLTEAGTGECW